MKKFIVFFVVCLISGFLLFACQRDRGVYAGNESDTYQPRPARQDMKGELVRVDVGGRRVAVRVESGMVQTFRVNDGTSIAGLENVPQANSAKAPKNNSNDLRQLAGKEGSEVTVQWTDENGAKIASNIIVTQVITSKNTRRSGRH